MRNVENDPPNVLKNRLGRPLKLSQNSKIGVMNVNILRPSNYEFITDSDLIGIGYLNNGNNSAFQMVQQIPDGQYSYDTFALAVQNCLNNMFITTGGDFTASTRQALASYDFGDGNYILATRYSNTTHTSCGVTYNPETDKYTIAVGTTPSTMLSANGSDCTSLVNINFTPGLAGQFILTHPASVGVQMGSFKLATPQSVGSFTFGQRIQLENSGIPQYHTRVSLTFINTVTGRIDLDLQALLEYRGPRSVFANCIVNNGSVTSNKHIDLMAGGSPNDLNVIFHRLAGKCGVSFIDSRRGPSGATTYAVLGTHSMDIDPNFWDNSIYDINYNCEMYFKDITTDYTQRGVYHSPAAAAISLKAAGKFIDGAQPQPQINQKISTIRETVRAINTAYFTEIMNTQAENDLNGFVDIPTQLDVPTDQNVEALDPRTLEFYFNPIDCNERLGFLYKSKSPIGSLAYYYASLSPIQTQTIVSDYSITLDSSEENQCVILIRGVPVSGICSDDFGSGNGFNVLDSLSLVWNENDGYIANFRPPIMQSVQNKEIMTLTELELNLVGPDGITPLEMAAGAVVTIYITGVIE